MEVQAVQAPRTRVDALAGAHRAAGPQVVCPVGAWRETGGRGVRAGRRESVTSGSVRAEGGDSSPLVDVLLALNSGAMLGACGKRCVNGCRSFRCRYTRTKPAWLNLVALRRPIASGAGSENRRPSAFWASPSLPASRFEGDSSS